MHAGLGRYSVDDIERVFVIERTLTADTDGCRSGRITIRLNVQTRRTSLQRLHGIVLLLFLQISRTDGGDSTGKVRLALGGITRDYDLFEDLAVFC